MSLWSLNEIHNALNCKNSINQNFSFSNISIDTRTLEKGSLFIPIKGEKFDGHNFINKAYQKGAIASLIEEKKLQKIKKSRIPLIVVKNTKNSLKKIATFSRNRIKNLLMICITGSSGKSTLKDWLTKILEKKYKTFSNFGNFNNEIGMPLTLANMPRNTQICVLELGMNSPGEINRLTKIAHPDVSIITNTGLAHLGNFKKNKEIAYEKSQILNYLNKNSYAILPDNSKYHNFLKKKATKLTKNVFSFGPSKKSSFRLMPKSKRVGYSSFLITKEKISLRKNTSYINWEINALVILGLIRILNLKINNYKQNIERLSPIKGRGETHNLMIKGKKITLIDESYNSNPDSLENAIKGLETQNYKARRKICVIGDMLELGKTSSQLHLKILKVLIKVNPYSVITIGNFTKTIYENLPKKIKAFHFNNCQNVYNKLTNITEDGDLIMIKGSNSTKLHQICDKLIKKY